MKFRKYRARIVLTLEGWLTVSHCQKLYLEWIIIVYINRDQKIAHGKKMCFCYFWAIHFFQFPSKSANDKMQPPINMLYFYIIAL